MKIDRLVLTAIIFLTLLLFVFYIFIPKYQKFKNVQLELANRETEFLGKAKYFSKLQKIYKELEKYKESLKKIELALPNEPSFASLIYFLEEKSEENGLVFRGANLIRTSPVARKSKIKESTISLELLGGYLSFRNFLSSLERSAYLIRIEKVIINPQGQIGDTYSFRLIIKVHSY